MGRGMMALAWSAVIFGWFVVGCCGRGRVGVGARERERELREFEEKRSEIRLQLLRERREGFLYWHFDFRASSYELQH